MTTESSGRSPASLSRGRIVADPEGRDTYTANATAYLKQLDALDGDTDRVVERAKRFDPFRSFGSAGNPPADVA